MALAARALDWLRPARFPQGVCFVALNCADALGSIHLAPERSNEAAMIHPRPKHWCLSAVVISLLCATAAQAHQHAHVHGRIQLGVAQEGSELVIDIHAPLESLLGFERVPRTAKEQALAADWAGKLRSGATLLRLDPDARCVLTHAELTAPVVGWGPTPNNATVLDGHADLEGQWVFRCAQPGALRRLQVGFFEASPHAQVIEVQWALDGRQGRQVLKRPQTLVNLGAGR